MIDFQVFQDTGPLTNGRGTPIAVTNWNMKNSSSYATTYFPGSPLIRPTVRGIQTYSYKVFTFFRLSGTYDAIKNIRFRVAVSTPAEASDAQLFFKMTNIYETPTNAFDGHMLLLADAQGTVYSDLLYPYLSTVGPHQATSRQIYYNNTTLYTNYFVTQMRVNALSAVGNTAEFELKFEAYEYGDF